MNTLKVEGLIMVMIMVDCYGHDYGRLLWFWLEALDLVSKSYHGDMLQEFLEGAEQARWNLQRKSSSHFPKQFLPFRFISCI